MGNAQTKQDRTLMLLYRKKEMGNRKKVNLTRQAAHIKSLQQLNTRQLKEIEKQIAEIENQ